MTTQEQATERPARKPAESERDERPRHVHIRECYAYQGPGQGQPYIICGKIAGHDRD